MPISYHVDHDNRLVLVNGAGVFTDDDVFGYQREIMALKDVLGYDELVDMTNVLRIDLPSFQRVKDLASLSAEMDPVHPPGRFAIIAPGDVPFMLGRLFKGIRSMVPGARREIGIFRTRQEAEAWLRRPRARSAASSATAAASDAGPAGSRRGSGGGKLE
jgi:hypothetical protein